MMYEDGAGRKVQRLSKLLDYIRRGGQRGVAISQLLDDIEFSQGLSQKRIRDYLRLLGRLDKIEIKYSRIYIKKGTATRKSL